MTQPPLPPQQPPLPPVQPAAVPPPTQAMPQAPPAGYYPPPPPGGYPPPPASLHKSSKNKTIAIIVAGVVGLGVLGGLGAVVLGGDDKDDNGDVTEVEARGNNGSGILDPEPVGSATPQPTDPTDPATEPTDPVTEPTDPVTEPTDPVTEPPVDGQTATIGAGVQIFVPSGWEVAGQSDNDIGLTDGNGSWAYALTAVKDPSLEATAALSANLDYFLPDYYTQVAKSEIEPLEAFGSVVSLAGMEYEALVVDGQSSVPVHGQVYGAVRQDGVVLLINVETSPAGDFQAAQSSWGPVLDGTMNLFGGS